MWVKLIPLVIISLLLPPCLFAGEVQIARTNPYIAGAVAAAGGFSPTYVNPNTGDGVFEATEDVVGGNYPWGVTITIPTGGTTVTSLEVYVTYAASATACWIGIYNNNETSALLGHGHCTPAGTAWCDVNGLSVAVTAGNDYYIFFDCDTYVQVQTDENSGEDGLYLTYTHDANPPDPLNNNVDTFVGKIAQVRAYVE